MSTFTSALFALSLPGFKTPHVPPLDVELDDDWKSFESLLGRFKDEYTQVKNEYQRIEAEFAMYTKDIHHIQMAVATIDSDELREKLEQIMDERLMSQEYKDYKQQLGVLGGRLKAMADVLKDTNAHRYNEFTCPVCMDKNVQMFLDPCGHLVCSDCALRLLRHNDERKCPTCRTTVTARRMYPTC